MKHLEEYENLNEAMPRKIKSKPLFSRFKSKFNPYSIEKDIFIREVYCNEDAPKELTKGKKYRLYAEFETGAMLSGKCFVVLSNTNDFMGYDSNYFLEEFQWDATKKYNL